VSIKLDAMTGRAEIRQGGRVQITSGLYEGELATVESVVGGVIPAAVVRTDAGRTRRVRTVDLIPQPGLGSGTSQG
jgi:transcription antitermination factor NusG